MRPSGDTARGLDFDDFVDKQVVHVSATSFRSGAELVSMRVGRAACGSVKDLWSDSMVPLDLRNVDTFSCSRDFVSKNIDTVSFVYHQYSIISTLIKFISSKMIATLRWPASGRAGQAQPSRFTPGTSENPEASLETWRPCLGSYNPWTSADFEATSLFDF